MENDFIFIDETDSNKKKVFHRKLYYESIKELIINFFNEKLVINEIHLKIINYLETLEDYDDVYFFLEELSYHWALCIIDNTFEQKKKLNGIELEKYVNFDKKFLNINNIKFYLEEI